jgi:large subunit ribosomal protein L21
VYADIRTGGKQYKVKVGDLIDVEKLGGDDGASLELEPLLVVDDDGNVTSAAADLAKAKVTASVVDHHRGKRSASSPTRTRPARAAPWATASP